ncbi:universal stress protein [Candidatus Methanoplasma termitum]|uniref:Universal stress protein n=1 Tax=Candidatus Methanoplasma termitum TaxID=1577791 RepID=A0A0A7LBX2_9ARCH|nr:universal stress protein [Candidatus Methanoplasma termitum]AIZ56508.1 universal stress protein [Candidatus Methanoplasma termitum]MCL2333244.1 universal stress protein [Candidatus Methanoplasma sp.]
MNFKKILLPTDGSEFTKYAVEKAIELAALTGGRITALYVLDRSVYTSSPMDTALVNIYETLEKEGRYATGYVKEKADAAGVEIEEKLIEGIPPKVILQEAESGGYDLIVMGTLGRTGISKLLMGSVAEKIIQNAKCPVMVAKAHVDVSE